MEGASPSSASQPCASRGTWKVMLTRASSRSPPVSSSANSSATSSLPCCTCTKGCRPQGSPLSKPWLLSSEPLALWHRLQLSQVLLNCFLYGPHKPELHLLSPRASAVACRADSCRAPARTCLVDVLQGHTEGRLAIDRERQVAALHLSLAPAAPADSQLSFLHTSGWLRQAVCSLAGPVRCVQVRRSSPRHSEISWATAQSRDRAAPQCRCQAL